MNFPDLAHLCQLQAELWNWPKSRAALMVGAGLSLNAEPLPGVTRRFPTWRQLVRAMFDELHPSPSNATMKNREELFAGASPLRIASEYEAAFGRRKIDLLILNQTPDSDYEPGRLHRLLLQLPWTDVFTTNYDTLLERTEVPGRAYNPICKASELTNTYPPRIIKLHGSFPSHTPFIITEEDYRTYPRKFAPLVNSVQQCLLENSFVLIGFSGDDPNFLEWTGWIRDQLGNEHAPIYLVGALSLEPYQRSLLSSRGVTPIDLGPLFTGLNPSQGLHAAVLEWFIYSLAAGKLPRPEKWPDFSSGRPNDLLGFPPILPKPLQPPRAIDPSPHAHKPLELVTFTDIVTRWRFERVHYPGWIILDDSKRSQLWQNTKFWIDALLSFTENRPAVDRLMVNREIHWRVDKALVPLFENWIASFEKALDETFVNITQESNLQCSAPFLQSEIQDAWFEVAFGLLREARETFNAQRWTKVQMQIEKVVPQYPKYSDEFIYQKALWAMWNIEFFSARDLLARWQPSPRSPLAAMWKAGLLAELDDLSESRSILRGTLSEIRNALRSRGNNIELLSLEGWCIYLLLIVETALDISKRGSLRDEFWERWQELKAWDCSPWPYKEYFDDSLSKPPPMPFKSQTSEHGFDPGEVSLTYHWSGDNISDYLPAFAYIRLFEKIGLPLRVRLIDISGTALCAACKWIASFIPLCNTGLLVRAGKIKEIKEGGSFSRATLATMDQKLAISLFDWCMQVFNRVLREWKGQGHIALGSAQEALFETLPEVLSRLTVRVDETRLNHAFKLALEFYCFAGMRAHIRMHEAAAPWFKRLYEAADQKLLLKWLPEIMRAPLFAEGTPAVIPPSRVWPDPMRCFPTERIRFIERPSDEFQPIVEAINWLLRRCASEIGEARQRALSRLIDVYHAKLMNSEQVKSFANLLWKERNGSGLPNITGFSAFGYLHLPTLDKVDVRQVVKTYILSLESKGFVTHEADGRISIAGGPYRGLPLIVETSTASKPLVQLLDEPLGTLEWSIDESRGLYDKVRNWWLNDKLALKEVKPDEPLGLSAVNPILETCKSLGDFLIRAIIPHMEWADEDKWTEFLDWLKEVRMFKVFPTIVYPYVLRFRPSSLSSFADVINADLNSEEPEAASAAAQALRHWIHLSSTGYTDNPPQDLLPALVNRVAYRRPAGILECVNQLSHLFVEKPENIDEHSIMVISNSLSGWALATSLCDSREEIAEFSTSACLDLQFSIIILAAAIKDWFTKMKPGAPLPKTICEWQEISDAATLPELRRAFGIWDSIHREPTK